MTFGKAWKHQVLHIKLANLRWQGLAGITYLNLFYLKCLWEGLKTPSFAHKIEESGFAGVEENNVFEYLLFEMPLGRHQNTEFRWGLHIKLKSLGFQGLAVIIYLNIFYLKCFWEGMKTPSFAHTIGKSALPGVGRNNIFDFFLKYLWESMETPSLA